MYPTLWSANQAWQYARKKTSLTQNILGAELPQALELEVDIEDGDAPCYGEDDDVAAQDILLARRESSQEAQNHHFYSESLAYILSQEHKCQHRTTTSKQPTEIKNGKQFLNNLYVILHNSFFPDSPYTKYILRGNYTH